MSVHSPIAAYQAALTQGFVSDSAQAQGVAALQHCFEQLVAGTPCQGVYLWGPVGRGKTWLMNSFHQAVQAQGIASRRQHFHHFMHWLHGRLFALTGTMNPLQQVAKDLAAEIKVLCFDEFFISDIGDAMLLGPLLQALFTQGLILVATSNEAPLKLYATGFNRERVLSALETLAAKVHTVHLDGGKDHRLHGVAEHRKYWLKTEGVSPLAQLFSEQSRQPAQAGELIINGRILTVLGHTQSVLWCTYAALCESHRSAADYMALCAQYQAILLAEVPALSAEVKEQRIARGTEDAASRVLAGDRALAAQSQLDNSVRRFIALVDECYEQRVPLYIEAAVPLAELYTEGALLFPFQRTVSRLQEMQRQNWFKQD